MMVNIFRNHLCWAVVAVSACGLLVAVANATEQTLEIGTPGEDGHLSIIMDEYGSFGDWTPQWPDLFDPGPDPDDPANNPTEASATFHTALYIYIDPSDGMGGGTHRGVLAAHGEIVDTYDDGNLFPYIVSENTTDGLPLTMSSVVGISDVEGGGGAIDLQVAVTNTVLEAPPGPNGEIARQLTQTYVFTNIASGSVDFAINKHIDEDLLWIPPNVYTDDRVGIDFGIRGYPAVYAQDGEATTAALVSSTTTDPMDDPAVSAFYYYAGKQGVLPPGSPDFPGGDCPEFDFGTDFQIWDNFAVPRCWRNHVAGVGYNVPGISILLTGDSHIGTEIHVSLGVGESYTVTYETVYGFRPIPPRFSAPRPTFLLVNGKVDENGIGEFLFRIKNENLGGEVAPDPIDVVYMDIEAGLLNAGPGAAGGRDLDFTLPTGWSSTNCTGFDANGHALVRLTNDSGESIVPGGPAMQGRLRVRTNDLSEDTNGDTGVTVPPLSVTLSFAQDQPDLPPEEIEWTAVCSAGDYSFGPTPGNGIWSFPTAETAFLPVPSLSAWAKVALLIVIVGLGVGLVVRSRRPVTA